MAREARQRQVASPAAPRPGLRHAPPAPGALPAPFTPPWWARLNTGTFEQALDARTRAAPQRAWRRPSILAGVLIGLLFAVVNQYVGLRTGLIVFGSWYVVFLLGLALRWGPAEINLAAVAGSGANFIVGGYAYVLPALFLVAALPGAVLPAPSAMVLAAATAGTALAGVLGALGFGALRRAWLVEQPLPYPSFEQYLQLLGLAHHAREGQPLRRTGALLAAGGAGAGAWAFLREWPLAGGPPLRALEGSGWYSAGSLQMPLAWSNLTWLSLSLSPLLVAVGWFMRLRIALVVAGGALFAWFLAVPLAVLLGVPAPGQGHAALLAFAGPVRAIAAGAIVGAGALALLRLRGLLGPALRDSLRLRASPTPDAHESPGHHTGWAALATLLGMAALLLLLGAPWWAALLVGAGVVAGILLLGAVAIKVAGETSIEPASAAGFLVVLALGGALAALGLGASEVALFALLGGVAFFAGITLMGNLLLDQKLALYVGNPPREVAKAALLGIVPGALVGGVVAAALGPALASGALDFPAPQARAYATLLGTGLLAAYPVGLVAFGAVLGAFVEWRTRLGTAFGLGLFLPLGIPLAFLLGAGLREAWERRAARRFAQGEERDRARLATYVLATGLMVGEALVGTAAALLVAFA
jgi:uncharacterized oligopeptide transporter (OPT) family protein